MRPLPPWALGACLTLALGCSSDAPPRADAPPGADLPPGGSGPAVACDAPEIGDVVTRLGARLNDVALLAPDAGEQIRSAYGELATPELLSAWAADPEYAPGRAVSSPWPERIEVTAVASAGGDACRAEAEVVYVANAAGGPREAARERVTLTVTRAASPRISAYEATGEADAPAAPGEAAGDPAEPVRRYYAALAARDYRTAYDLWGGNPPRGQSYEQFAAGFAETERVAVEIGEPGRVEAAAGSRYVEVPVTVRATTRGGEAQRFEGTYTVRRAVVDGATPAQRAWHLYSATLTRR